MGFGHAVETGRMASVRPATHGLGVIMMVLVLLVGCAHEKAYKRGTKLSEQAQYERAIEELETAIRLAEEGDNHKAARKYREKLEQVKEQAGRFYYREAEIRFERADLGAAQGFVERCIRYCPQEQMYASFHQRVREAIAEAERVRADALSLAEQRQWEAAVQRMNEALAMYRTMPGGEGDLQRIRDRAYRHYLDRAQERLGQNDLEGAETEARTALVYQNGAREAKAVIQTVADRREAAQLIARGRALLEQGNADEALSALERANRLHCGHAELPELLGAARRAVCDRWLEQGRREMAAGEVVAALRLFRKSDDLLRGYGNVGALLSEVRSQLAEIHLDASRQFQQSDAAGGAVLHAVVALGYEPENSEARRQLAQCAEQVRRNVGYTIAFVGFRAAPHESLAATLNATMLEHLMHVRPANVMLVERADLQAILGEQGLSTSEDFDSRFRTPAGSLQGVNAMIVGEILDAKIATESRQTGYGESTYQDGYRPEPNPDYVRATARLDAALHELERARRRLAEAEARLARYRRVDPRDAEEMARKRKAQAAVDEAKHRLANAAMDVGAARLRVAAIPPEVLMPNMVQYRYPIETFTRRTKVTLMLKMLDATTGEVMIAERLEGQHAQSDRVISGDPQRNVPDDPLDFPADATLLEAAANASVSKLKRVLGAACLKHGERFAAGMRRAEAAGDTTHAADCSIKYLFAYPAGHEDTNRMLGYLRAYLAEEDGLVDIRSLLQTHCHLLQDN
jgi:tetratricopeptide (TPR) repeat protein